MKNVTGNIGNVVNTDSVLDCRQILNITPVQAIIEDGEFKYMVSSIENKTHDMITMLDSNDNEFSILIDKDTDTSMLIDLI